MPPRAIKKCRKDSLSRISKQRATSCHLSGSQFGGVSRFQLADHYKTPMLLLHRSVPHHLPKPNLTPTSLDLHLVKQHPPALRLLREFLPNFISGCALYSVASLAFSSCFSKPMLKLIACWYFQVVEILGTCSCLPHFSGVGGSTSKNCQTDRGRAAAK